MKVMRFPEVKSQRPTVDLRTVFETLSYMREDLARDPSLKNVADALSETLKEIRLAQESAVRSTSRRTRGDAVDFRPVSAKFLASRKPRGI